MEVCDDLRSEIQSETAVCVEDEKAWPRPWEGWPEDENKATAPAPPRGTFFEWTLDFRDPEGHDLMARVLQILGEGSGRGRPVKPENRYALVRAILSNGLNCHYRRERPFVAYRRMYAAEMYRDGPAWLSGKTISRAVDRLQAADLLSLNLGARQQAVSTYAVTAKLLNLAEECGVTVKSITQRVPSSELVRLYASKPKRKPGEQKQKGERMTFLPTPETLQMTADLQDINDFLSQQDISVELTPAEEREWAAKLNADPEHRGSRFLRPDFAQTDLYRVFNNGSFDQGGRLYGGWWINAPKRFRPRIKINGRPTVELDYAGCHINMLYHERDRECDGDPYELPAIVEYEAQLGLEPGTYRHCVKQYTQALINCRKRGRPSDIELEEGTEFPPDFRPIVIARMIQARHKPIADAFRSNAGLRLQRIDSDIAMKVITTSKKEGWVALPIHDSFITLEDYTDRLRCLMKEEYKEVFKHEPIVKMVEFKYKLTDQYAVSTS